MNKKRKKYSKILTAKMETGKMEQETKNSLDMSKAFEAGNSRSANFAKHVTVRAARPKNDV